MRVREGEKYVFICVIMILQIGIDYYDGDMMEMTFFVMYMMRRNDSNWKGLGFCCGIVY